MQLLRDVLEQTMLEPQSARHWHVLFDVWSKTGATPLRADVAQRLAATSFDDPRADVLRLTFLASTTGNAGYVAAAAERMLAIAPTNPDRLAAFASFHSLQAMVDQPTREQFVAALEGARLPQIVNRLGTDAVSMIPGSLRARVPHSIERIAVVAPHIGSVAHTPSVLVANVCDLLARAGRSVHIFSCQEFLPPLMAQYHGCSGRPRLAEFDYQYWQRSLPAGVGVTVSDLHSSLRARWQGMFAKLAEFAPDAILMIGLYAPFAAALYTIRPVVGLSTNAVPPLAPVDVWLTASESQTGEQDVWQGAFPTPLGRLHPQRVKFPAGPFALRRGDLGLPPDAVVWVTVSLRMENDIRGPWCAQMIDALQRHPNAVWLLVGCENGVAPEPARNVRRVVALPPRKDVAAVLALCDVCVNPPRMGGGFSVIEAMASRLPVVSFADSDGGDKVGEHAVRDFDAYFRLLADLTASGERRAKLGTQLRERFRERFDLESSGAALIESLELATVRARARLR